MVCDTACLPSGVPETLISDRGGAFTAQAFAAVLTRGRIRHEPIESTPGECALHGRDTYFNMQRRWDDDPCSFTTPPPRPSSRLTKPSS
jgi:hypothetical protein